MDSNRAPSTSQDPSRATSLLRNREVDDLYNGDLSLKQEPLSRTVRIYISSELSDSAIEKRHLRTRVFPSLRQYCQSLGLQLVVVDLFKYLPSSSNSILAVRESGSTSNDDVMYTVESSGFFEMARKEIKLCQEVSIGPTFATLLAQRYGYKPLHRTIPEEDFKQLVVAIDDSGMRQLVTQWYRLDTNALPPEYVLQSMGGMSLSEWKGIHQALSKTTRKAAKVALGKDISKAQHYTMSAIEGEVAHGIFNQTKDPNQSCLWLKRTFTDLMEQRPSGDGALVKYADLSEGKRGLEFDMDTIKVLNHLKEARMPAKYVGLEATNILEFSLKWQRNKGLDLDGNPSHADYLSELSEQLLTALETMVTNGFNALQQAADPVAQEILCHASYCKKRMIEFMDRPAITSKILAYLQGPSTAPLVVHGAIGSGKTSIMAGVAGMMKTVHSLKKAALVLRLIHATPRSHSVRHFLLDTCKQLCMIYKQDVSELPADYRSLCEHMRQLLMHATADKPLVVVIDGVDELSPEDGALGMSWLPLSLPPHIKIVLSTSSEIKYSCFPVLQSLLANHQENFIQVPQLSPSDCAELLKHSLKARKRTLIPMQERVALEALQQCPNPLYLQFILRDVGSWNSYLWNSNWIPPTDLDGATEQFFHTVESKLGIVFTRCALGYITASKDGLSEMELMDVLSSDDEVMQEVNQRWKPLDCIEEETDEPSADTMATVPSLLMSQLYHTLTPFLDYQMGTDGVKTLRWTHRHLQETASRLYLSTPSITQTRCSTLADYFSGTLQKNTTSDSDAGCFEQPIMYNTEHGLYNVRKLSFLPHLLTSAGKSYELQRLLVDYDWIKASICSLSCLDLVAEFAAILPLVPIARRGGSSDSMYELVLLRDALSLSVDALFIDPQCLSSQLLGRLMPYVTESTDNWQTLKRIVLRALDDHIPTITPLQPLLNLPGGPLLVTMEGHRGLVTSLASTVVRRSADDCLAMIIISSSVDKTLKTWDIKTTGVMKTFDGHTDKVLSVALTVNGRYAVSGSADRTLRHWLVSTAKCLCVLSGHNDSVNAVGLTSDGFKTVSASTDKTMKVWNTDTESRTYGQVIFTIKGHREPILSLSLFEDLLLASLTLTGSLSLTDIVSGESKAVQQEEGDRVTALATTKLDWFSYLVTGTEGGLVVVRDIESGRTSHSLHHPADGGSVLAIAAGQKIIASFKNKDLVVWDVTTGFYLYSLHGHRGTAYTCSLADKGDLLITGADDHTIQIWDLKRFERSTGGGLTQQHRGSVTTIAVSPCGNFGLSAGSDSMILIHELSTMKSIKVLKGHCDSITALHTLRDGRRFLSASTDDIKLWEGESGEVVMIFSSPGEKVTCVTVSVDAELLLSGGDNGIITFWSMKTGEKLKSFNNHDTSVIIVGFAKGHDFHYFLSVARSGEVCIRDLVSAKVVNQSQIVYSDVGCVSLSPNSSLLAIGCEDSACYITRVRNSTRAATLLGHKRAVTSVCVLPSNKQCLTASEDKTIRLFDIIDGECVSVFHTDYPVSCLCVNMRGDMIIYGTHRGWVSTAFNATDGEVAPVIKDLRGIAASFSSLTTTTAIDSQASFDSELPLTPVAIGPLQIDSLESTHSTENAIEQNNLPGDNSSESKNDISQPDLTDYPLDVEVKVIDSNAKESTLSFESAKQTLESKVEIVQDQNGSVPSLNAGTVNGWSNRHIATDIKEQVIVNEQSSDSTSNRDISGNTKSSTCSLL